MDELIKAMSDEELEEFRVKHPDLTDQVETILQARIEVVEAVKATESRDELAIETANRILGNLPEYTPEWRLDEATRAISITTVEVDDTRYPEATVGEGLRYPQMLVRQVSIGTAVTMVKEKSAPTTRKRKVKDVYRLGSVPLELLLDGQEHGYYTWNQIIISINENHRELLRVNDSGNPESIIETTASGVQDLRTAGFLGVER